MVHPRRGAIVAVVAAASMLGWWAGRSHAGPDPTFTVVRAIDGDTIVVEPAPAPTRAEGRATVRLLGVDTPETHHPTKPVQCFGPQAAQYTAARLTGARVQLEFDRVRRDPYGRLLAYVHVDGARFNDELLRLGYARLLVIAPNGSHARAMLQEELTARRARRGLWGAC